MTVLDQACEQFKVSLMADEPSPNGRGAFWGAGAFGFVFRVKRLGHEHSECLALICVSGINGDFNHVARLQNEYTKMCLAKEKCPHIVKGVEKDGFKILVDENKNEVGAALLLSHVGEDSSNLTTDCIVDSLGQLHSNGF